LIYVGEKEIYFTYPLNEYLCGEIKTLNNEKNKT